MDDWNICQKQFEFEKKREEKYYKKKEKLLECNIYPFFKFFFPLFYDQFMTPKLCCAYITSLNSFVGVYYNLYDQILVRGVLCVKNKILNYSKGHIKSVNY